jgi:hypothetical protein
VVDPGGSSDAAYLTVVCDKGDLWGMDQVDVPIEPAPTACGATGGSGRVVVDGILAPGEWDGASVFGPVAVELGGRVTAATVHVRPGPRDLAIAVRFDRDLRSLAVLTVGVRLDAAPVDGSWNAGADGDGDDGLVANLQQGWFFDDHFSTAVEPNQGQGDGEHGGTVDGSMAVGYEAASTTVEMSHPLDGGDARDTALAAGEAFGLSIGTYMEDATGRTASTDLVPWSRSGPMRWVTCSVAGG